ncbi:TadE/TadG family type IV pilus assembly protein [Sphingomonas metalli]|uniref:TadE/TadG family type IV pilus assembly protein n=1 Tax=Sphingomonas metalli TaxID=1779358 RepID=UPI001E4E2672|nr:hypothetical protein [Sphingomonas metalli]
MTARARIATGLRALRRRLRHDRRGTALMEFAFTLPLVLTVGGWGTELAWLAITNLRISQLALNLADTASRVGASGSNGVTQLREADINDTFTGIRLSSGTMALGANGRVILSSLENTKQSYDTDYTQRIHWQRCFGMKSGTGYDSSYGTAPPAAGTDATQANAGTTTTTGMGDAGFKVMAPQNSSVMFVEINYRFQPLFGSLFVAPRIIHYSASLLVRDNRDFTQVYNPTDSAVTRSTCDRYTA